MSSCGWATTVPPTVVCASEVTELRFTRSLLG